MLPSTPPPMTAPSRKRARSASLEVDGDGDDNPFLSSDPATPTAKSVRAQQQQAPLFLQPRNISTTPVRGSRALVLPTHHATLYVLHAALEHALVVHLATMGTAGSTIEELSGGSTSSGSAASTLAIPELITLAALRPLVERSSGRRFGKQELARLMWIWGTTGAQRSNIGFTLTRTRTLDKSGRRVQDYALGVRLTEDGSADESESEGEDAGAASSSSTTSAATAVVGSLPRTPPRSRPRASLPFADPVSPSPSPGSGRFHRTGSPNLGGSGSSSDGRLRALGASSSPSLYARRGIGLVALWNNGIERRKRIVRRRLLRWCLDCYASWKEEQQKQDAAPLVQAGQGGLLTPSSSREPGHVPGRHRVKDFLAEERMQDWDVDFPLQQVAHIPMADLPPLDVASTTSSTTTATSASPLSASPQISRLEAARQAHRIEVAESELTLGRKLTLAERIRAKEDAVANKRRKIGGSSDGKDVGSGGVLRAGLAGATSAHAVALAARKRSSLSRLQGVAESIYMLFVSRAAGARNDAPTRFTPLPMHEIVKAICSASRTAMSPADVHMCLDQLQLIAPGFVEVDSVGAQKWVKLVGRVQEPVGAVPVGGDRPASVLAAVRRCVRGELQRLEATEA